MTDICIPISHLGDNQIAEVLVSIGGIQRKHNFKIEAFPWNTASPVEVRIDLLKRMIEGYDKDWELVQIYNPGEKDKFIHVLFKEKF
ncbi:MAG TPA: hypothetical protein VMT35_13425 [Ignavibacteriaceae bacterium]|nr:hypothetical protein [Ignavibacteriaceae bacterium]